VVVGGVWTYFKFFRSRTFRPRLSLGVATDLRSAEDRVYLHVRVSVSNRGMAVIPFDSANCQGFLFVERGTEGKPEWTVAGSFPVLVGHGRIEPDEEIVEEKLLPIPRAPRSALKVEVFVAAKGARESAPAWSAETFAVHPHAPGGTHGTEDRGPGTGRHQEASRAVAEGGPSTDAGRDRCRGRGRPVGGAGEGPPVLP
jgi:hypothetical protein